MRSYEILRRAIDSVGVKAVAHDMRLSTALVYKWCQEYDPNDPDRSGARNPLDRVADIQRVTRDTHIINWLCHEAGGFFCENPQTQSGNPDSYLLARTQQMVRDFSELLQTVTHSIEDDGVIGPGEADKIREAWESLKSSCETFTVSCEIGRFHSKGSPKKH